MLHYFKIVHDNKSHWNNFYYSLFHILSVKSSYQEFLNLQRIEKKIEKSSIKQIIGFDREDMKNYITSYRTKMIEKIVQRMEHHL